MIRLRRGDERFRGGDASAGIETLHAFSFGPHYDPDNLRFGGLIACNEERLAAGAGFDEHPHRDTEIVTWVVEGELTHEDSTGRATTVRPGDVQRLSAGSGVRHVERNAAARPLRFVQMWLLPAADAFGGEAEYDVVRGIADGMPYAVPRAGALLHVRRLAAGEPTAVPNAPRVYAHVVRGAVGLGGERLGAGDSARVLDADDLVAEAIEDAELLLWELPPEASYG